MYAIPNRTLFTYFILMYKYSSDSSCATDPTLLSLDDFDGNGQNWTKMDNV